MRSPVGKAKNTHAVRRPLAALFVLALLCSTMGASCSRSLRSPFAAWTPPAPEVLKAGATLEQITAAVNQNAARIYSLETDNASITVPGMPGIPLLRGDIAAQRPGRIRLRASTALTGPEVDLGANDELFWAWVRRSEPPALYFARHDQFAGAAQRMMPIEPQWLLDAIGFAEFRPGDVHEGPLPLDQDRVEIKSTIQSRLGPLTKRTVVDARVAWVVEQHVYDSGGTLLASTTARSHRYHREAGVSLPQVVEIRIPASNLSLTVDMGEVRINSLAQNPQLWALPTIAGAPPVDLGAAPAPAAAPRLGDQLTRADWQRPAPAMAVPMESTSAATAFPSGASPLLAVQQAPLAPQQLTAGGVALDPRAAALVEAGVAMQQIPRGGTPAVAGGSFQR